jgi:hypothetical protein
MKRTAVLIAAGLLIPAAARADEAPAPGPPRLRLALAAGFGPHGGAALHLAPVRLLALGLDLAVTHRQGGTSTNRAGTTVHGVPSRTAVIALAVAKANAFPSRTLSPYAFVGYGAGAFSERGATRTGKAAAVGAGLDVRLSPRATAFVEGRLALMDVLVAGEDPWLEAPVRVGVRLGL